MAVRFRQGIMGAAIMCPLIGMMPQEVWGDELPQVLTLEEVTVYAQRRPTPLQETALAVEALSGKKLAAAGVTDAKQLAEQTPGVIFASSAGSYQSPAIRAAFNFATSYFTEAAITTNVNNVVLGRPTATQGLFFDLERIEIVKGPQGTLYGRNATGGTLNVMTRQPVLTEFSGEANIDAGNYGLISADAALNIPLGQSTAVRVAGQSVEHDGYFSDGTGDKDLQAGRVSVLSWLTPDLSLSLIADYAQNGGRGVGSTLLTSTGDFSSNPWDGLLNQLPVVPGPGGTSFPLPLGTYQDDRFAGASAELQWFASAGTFTATTAYRLTETDYLSSALGFFTTEQAETDQSTAELRFASADDLPVRFTVGAYYFGEATEGTALFDQTSRGVSNQQYELQTDSYAGYLQLGYALTESLRLTAGGRYTYEKKSVDGRTRLVTPRFVPPAPPPNDGTQTLLLNDVSDNFDATTWSAGVEWTLTESNLLYLNVGTGFKAGGFFSAPVAAGNQYDPEYITSYALGLKSRITDRLQVNVEAFHEDYKDQQISHLDGRFLPGGTLITIQATENAGHATVNGLDLDVDWIIGRGTVISLTAQYLDAIYDDLQFTTPIQGPTPPPYGCPFTPMTGLYLVDCSGMRATHAPELSGNFSIEQTFMLPGGGAIVAYAATHYESERETRINYLRQTRAEAYTTSSFTLSYVSASGTWRVGGYIRNIEDDAILDNALVHANYPSINVVTATLKSPRTYGVRVGVSF